MKLVHWDPFQELVAVSYRLHRTLYHPDSPPEDTIGTWIPAVDVFEKQDQLVIRAELPGLQREDIDVRVENGVLTLHGERKQDTEIKDEHAYRMERIYGAFSRSFTLPTSVDATKVAASYKDGVLELTIPKAETAKPKQIEIKAA
jgi:HSP20 family protein